MHSVLNQSAFNQTAERECITINCARVDGFRSLYPSHAVLRVKGAVIADLAARGRAGKDEALEIAGRRALVE